jgi:hypothetical protein
MSTQKRANRCTPATTTRRPGRWFRRQRLNCTGRRRARGKLFPARYARYGCADAGGVTAALRLTFWSMWAYFHPGDEHLSPGAAEWLATKFLQADLQIRQAVRLVFTAERTGSPPSFRTGRPLHWLAALGAPVSPRSSLPPIPFPSGHSCLHLTLPQAPVAEQRRAERYDGKRDLYFLHAA